MKSSTSSLIYTMEECIENANRLSYWCKANKALTNTAKCDKLKENYLKYCKETFESFGSFQTINQSQSSLENNSTCFSDNVFGGNTLNDTIKSPNISGERENPLPLIIFSSRF